MNTEPETRKTAGIIIVGNEILSGRVHDTNSAFLAAELRELGVHLKCIMVVPDEPETIGTVVKEFSDIYDYVFAAGGIGPTHDDVTMAGIAGGFKTTLMKHPELEKFFESRYGNALNKATLKMADVPDGAELIAVESTGFPVVAFKNIYIFPGIPEYLRNKFSLIKERFRSSSFYEKRLFLNTNESAIAEMLDTAVRNNREVTFGSYPVIGNPDYTIIISAESKSESALQGAVKDLLDLIPEEQIVRTE